MRTTVCINLIAALVLCGSCDRASKLPSDNAEGQQTHSIAYLRSLGKGSAVRITEDIVVQGVVTANDLYGEFYKTLVIEDATGAIEIAADHTTLSDDYPTRAEVRVYCNGLVLGDYGGKMQLGVTPDSDYGVGRIPRAELGRYMRLTGGKIPIQPARKTFAEIAARDVGRYVCFEGIHFAEPGPWCDTDGKDPVTTERQIVDHAGRTFTVRTLASCAYANEHVPSGTCSLNGIIDYFNGKFALRVINREAIPATAGAQPTAYPSTGEYSARIPTR